MWADPEKRAHQSATMVEVQSKRKEQLSKSAKKNWASNRDTILVGIRAAAKKPGRNSKNRHKQKIYNGEYLAECERLYGNRFDYSQTKLVDWKTKIIVICRDCGNKLYKFPNAHMQWGACEYCGMSNGERSISDFLNDLQISGKIFCPGALLVHDRSSIPPLELDLYLPKHRIAIEYHGLFWHSCQNKNEMLDKKYLHQNKALTCADANIRLLQIFDFEWSSQNELLRATIMNKLKLSNRLNARDMSIEEIDNQDAKQFLDSNHLAGHRPAAISLALKAQNNITAIMTFSKYLDGYEIIRLSSMKGTQIRGGASKLLHHFIKTRQPKVIYTYADLRYSTGAVYYKLGFSKLHITSPGYFYTMGNYRDNNFGILSRQRCQKHKLPKLLGDCFNPNLTEAENMFNNGYRRVWDAGHTKFKMSL